MVKKGWKSRKEIFTVWAKKKENKTKVRVLTLAGILLTITFFYSLYLFLFPNTKDFKETQYFLIYDNYTLDSVAIKMVDQGLLKNASSFKLASSILGYSDDEIKRGRYKIKPGMSNLFMIKEMKSGRQTPSKVTLHNIRTIEELCGKLSNYLITDSLSYLRFLTDSSYLEKIGYTQDNIMTVFLPNTYEMYWDTPPEKVMEKFIHEKERFWTPLRKHKADSLHFTIDQIYTLASIIDKETNKVPERPDVAGVYLNRLRQGMPLQADPTVVFATRDFTITRVMEKHILFESPYNTYLHTGLPPGPICMPEISSIDAVLNATPHVYLFFCAKPDLTGYHVFATTYEAHLQNARIYREFLDKNGY